jgi:protocatechuate 3,4-dioxygenase beta subunit
LDGGPPGLSPSAVVAWGSSDRSGRFELRGLTPETPYRVEDAQAGLFGTPVSAITARPGSPSPPLRLVLAVSQGVRGRVLDLAGQPVPEAEVLLRAARPPKRSDLQPIEPLRPEEEPYRAATDARGIFTIRELPALQVDVIARKPGFAPSVVRGLQIRPGKTPQPAGDLVLRPGVRLAGRVVDRAGRGIAGAAVHLVQQIDDLDRLEARLRERQPAAVSTGDGTFVLGDQPSGAPLSLVISAQGFLPAGLRGVRAPVARPVVVRLEPAALVRGRVLDEDGAGIPGARISLEWRGSLPEKPSIRTSEHAMRTAVADREGRFELRSVPEGSGEVTVEADGFVAADPLSVAIPQDPRNEWTLVLQRGAILEGRISTRQGDPVGGARVTVDDAQTRSDDDGKYLLTGVPLGEVEVEVLHADYPRQVHNLEIESGSNLLDVQLQGGHRVTGVVISAAREPVPGASVSLETLIEGRDQRRYSAHTGTAGTFELPTVADGEYRIVASADGFAEEKPPASITIRGNDRNDLEVILDRGASIVGRVLGLPREELAWVEVSAEGDDADAGSPVVRVDAEGRFALRHLALGNWQVRARHPQRQREVEVRAVLRTHGEEAVRDLRFGGGLSLTGRVLLGDEPLAGALVSLRAQSHSLERSAVTDYRGEFELADLDTDRYHLGVTDRKTLALHNEEIVLEEDRQVEIQLRSGTVSGNVLDSSSRAPVAGALLALRPLAGADFMVAGTSEEDGSFLLPRVPEGRYRLAARADGYTSAEQEVEVAGAGATGLDVKLAPTQGLDLVVRLASGQPPRLVHLRATSAGGGAVSETRIVGADGRLRLATLPAGEWDLWVAAPGGASMQTRVRAPGEAVRIDLPPAGHLAVQVPELAESSLVGTVAVTGESRQPFSTLTFGGEVSSTWPLKAGTAIVEGLPAGLWTVTVLAPDGRTWTKAVATTGSDGAATLE